MANDLLIKINADAKNAIKAFDDIKSQTEDLEGKLKTAALVSGAAFAALTAEVFLSVKAFNEADKATKTLNLALQNQGIYTDDLAASYKDYANAVQDATGIDDDAITSAQAVAQGFLGQTKITKELTFAIADLGEKMGGDLNGAATLLGRTIGTSTNALARQGLHFASNATEAEKMAKTLEFVNQKAGGLAALANEGVGGIRGLSTAFGNFQEQIGARFAPVISTAIRIGTDFFKFLGKHEVIADVAAALVVAGIAVSGLVLAISLAIPAFTAITAAAAAFGIAANVALLGIPLIIGAIVASITLLALNWEKVMGVIKVSTSAMVTLVSELFKGLGAVLSGAFSLSPAKIKDGLNQITGAFQKAADAAIKTDQELMAARKDEGEKQSLEKKKLADRLAAEKKREQDLIIEIEKQGINLLKLQNENASTELIALKQKEIESLKALQGEKTAAELALIQERYAAVKALEEQQRAEDIEREIAFRQIQAETKAELEAQGIEVDGQLRADKLALIEATAKTEADIDRQLQEEILSRRIAARNAELLDRKKYGEAYSKINKFINSEEVQGTKNAAGELVALQQSKNATLKSIGKIAAIANITIGTAESALNIYRGFSTIPIIGPALGVAGAAAAIAFGGEKLATVRAAQTGGLVEGGIPGRDSVPFLLEPGELVVPKRNFNEVVGAVQGGGPDNSQMVALLESIDAKISTSQTTIINGDVQADDSYIDSLVRKISDAIEFRNGQITGVTT